MKRITVAIDGPAGAGKSTVARLVAQKLELQLLDTGAMYRAVAIKAREEEILHDPRLLADLAAKITFDQVGGDLQVDGRALGEEIRTLEIGQLASEISTYGDVRRQLVEQQKVMILKGGFVLEGRDVTTVVAPHAEVKVFLTASIEERARRRWMQLRENQPDLRLQTVVREVVDRDHRDYTRSESPLQLAEDAHVLESFGQTPEEVAAKIASFAPPSSS
jgi:CMP/dCMP kinase